MNIFKTVPMKWTEIGVIKISLLCVGVAIGATWPQVFAPYALWIFCAGLALGIFAFFAWAKK